MSVGAVAGPLPLSNHPSFPAKHSRARHPLPPAPLPLSSRMRGPIPLPVIPAPPVGAVREPPVPFPSLTTRHSQLSTAEPRNLVVVAPPPSRAPPVVLADAGTHPPARHSSAPLRVGAVREPPVPFPSLTTRHSQLSTAESRNLVVVAPPPSRAPPVVLADAGTHPPARHSSAPLRVGAVREPPVPFPSLTTRHSQLSTAEPRNLVVVAPPPSRAPPVVLADAGTHPPARHSSAPLRVGAVRRTVPSPSPL